MDERSPAVESYRDIAPAERVSPHLVALKRFWWLVVASAVLGALVAYVVSLTQHKLYDASARVLLTNSEPVNLLLHTTAAPSLDPERDLNTDVVLVKLDSVARRVRAELGLPASVSTPQILRGVRVAPEGTSNLVVITDRDRSPVTATALANAFARQYVLLRRREAQNIYQTAAQQAELQLAQLNPAQLQGPHARDLRTQLQQLKIAGSLQTGGAQLIDPATVPTTPASPRPKFATAVGLFAGLIFGVLVALVAGVVTGVGRQRTAAAALGTHSMNGHSEVAASDLAGSELLEPGERSSTPPAPSGQLEP
jgi:uncharacterized protein involved in exopolysaccharide biosynthesis